MSLRWTILGVILITFIGLVFILSFSLQGILVPHFREEENRAADLNVQRVLGVIENERVSLAEAAGNWASRDEIYDFMQSAQPEVIQRSLSESVLLGLNIDMLAIINLQGQIVYVDIPGQDDTAEPSLPTDLIGHLKEGDFLAQTSTSPEIISGLASAAGAPLQVVSAPLLKSSGEGLAAGTLLVGRFLDTDEINRFAGVVRFPLTIAAFDAAQLPQDFAEAKANLSEDDTIWTNPINDTQMNGFALLTDVYGQPAFILRVEQGRSIYRNSQIVLLYLYTAMIMGALLFSVMTFLAFDRMALARIRLLGKEVTRIGAVGDLSARVTVVQSDELSRVGQEINGMLANLQTLSHRLVEIQESERREIALELHDEIGQLLTGLKMQLDANPESGLGLAAQPLEKARALSDELINKVRNLSLDLRPTMLDDLGLLPALLWHFDRFTELTGVRVDFSQNGVSDCRFSSEVESTAYRVIQEALTNAARHSGASEVSVRATFRDNLLTIQVEDRGEGFSVQQTLESSRTRGLRGMEERVALVGGSLTIDSVSGWGTSILVELPAKALPVEGSDDDYSAVGG